MIKPSEMCKFVSPKATDRKRKCLNKSPVGGLGQSKVNSCAIIDSCLPIRGEALQLKLFSQWLNGQGLWDHEVGGSARSACPLS